MPGYLELVLVLDQRRRAARTPVTTTTTTTTSLALLYLLLHPRSLFLRQPVLGALQIGPYHLRPDGVLTLCARYQPNIGHLLEHGGGRRASNGGRSGGGWLDEACHRSFFFFLFSVRTTWHGI